MPSLADLISEILETGVKPSSVRLSAEQYDGLVEKAEEIAEEDKD